MKMTRWFIQHDDARGQWIDSAHNPHEGWESRESASLGVASILKRTKNISIKTISREVEVSAKDVVKVINQTVSLEIAGSAWLRREEEDLIVWNRVDTVRGDIYRYKNKRWIRCDALGYRFDCEEPEVEQIWREYCE
jgi:hypothetical protein